MSLIIRLPFFYLWLFLIIFSQIILFQNTAFAKSKSLVLQQEVSHPRNTDQISIVFRQSTVELVVNTSSWQKENNNPRLGRFVSNLTPKLKQLKKQIEQFHTQLKQTVSVLSLIKDSRFQPPPSPHAPILRINKEEIKEGHSYFQPLARIIHQIWQVKWICLECTTYQRKGNTILRTLQSPTLITNTKEPAIEKLKKRIFSKKKLNCIPKNKGKIECIDPHFGIFKI